MKAKGKITKTEIALLFLAAVFLIAMMVMTVRTGRIMKSADYVVTTGRKTEETVTPEAAQPVNVNTADPEQLQTLPGIGPALAQRIVDDRSANGPFLSAEDLLRVSGIGEKTLEDLRPYITVEAAPSAKEMPTEDKNT